MPGKEDYFLTFNKDEIFKNLIAVEGHFRNVKPGFESGDLACIVKHLADIEGHADEAISHSLIAEGKEVSEKYQQLRDMVREFRHKVQRGEITPEEGIKKTRELRAFFEKFNPSYDVSKCATCGPIEETVKKLREILTKIEKRKPSIKDLEESMAKRVIDSLSKKYNVPPPKLEILDECHDPSFGLYENGTIKVCRGGVSAHVLVHEFGHYLQHKFGKPMDEVEAEEFAIKEIRGEGSRLSETAQPNMMEKPLYAKAKYNYNGESDMPLTWREVGLIVGSQHMFKGIEKIVDYVDVATGKVGAPVFERPSTWINTIGGAFLVLIPRFVRMPDILDVMFTVGGGQMTTKVWDYLEEYAAVGATATFVPATPVAPPTPVSAPTPTEKAVEKVGAGKYQVTG